MPCGVSPTYRYTVFSSTPLGSEIATDTAAAGATDTASFSGLRNRNDGPSTSTFSTR